METTHCHIMIIRKVQLYGRRPIMTYGIRMPEQPDIGEDRKDGHLCLQVESRLTL